MFMSAHFDSTTLLPKEGEALWDYWLSLNPMAPAFGVPWRFGQFLTEVETPVAEAPAPKVKPKAKAKPKAAPKPVAVVEEAVVIEAVDSAEAVEAVEVVEAPAPKPVEVPVAEAEAAPATPDELTLIKGIGPKMAEKLHAAGVTTFAQIAAWDEAKIAEMGETLGGLPGAITRADWVGQAKDLV